MLFGVDDLSGATHARKVSFFSPAQITTVAWRYALSAMYAVRSSIHLFDCFFLSLCVLQTFELDRMFFSFLFE